MSLNFLFDLDGTLTDPFIGISRCIIHALQSQGLPVPDTGELHAFIGPPLLQSFSQYIERQGTGNAEQALADYRQCFGLSGLFENTVYEGIPGNHRRGRGEANVTLVRGNPVPKQPSSPAERSGPGGLVGSHPRR